MLRRMRSKKGFTLAELLIVVAIIAILVAIAVPLFVGSLAKAKEATKNANIRAVRGAAVVYLLEHVDETDSGEIWNGATTEDFAGWDVTATITSSGEITDMKITVGNTIEEESCEDSGSGYAVQLHIDNTEVTANASSSSSGGGDSGAGAGG